LVDLFEYSLVMSLAGKCTISSLDTHKFPD